MCTYGLKETARQQTGRQGAINIPSSTYYVERASERQRDREAVRRVEWSKKNSTIMKDGGERVRGREGGRQGNWERGSDCEREAERGREEERARVDKTVGNNLDDLAG